MIVIASLYRDNKIKFYNSLGINNWWIVKPAGVSRGTGIKI
jgi:hypothetical protein